VNKGLVVSVVDDDPSIRRGLHALFRSAGLRVATFASAEEYLRLDGPASTECLILDLEMPGMDGLQLQQRLRVDGHIFPIVMLTAHGAAAARIQALRAGAVAFLQKPCDGEVLLATIESARLRGGKGRSGH
jgi:FixJ family two-component response regulator